MEKKNKNDDNSPQGKGIRGKFNKKNLLYSFDSSKINPSKAP